MVGEYEIVRRLGEGGFGIVYEAIHSVIEKRVAIKVLSVAFGNARVLASRFIEEARAVNRIEHDNVVDIFNFGELQDGSLYLVMELLEGEALADYLADHGTVEPPLMCEILGPISAALEAAHAKEIVHRDLKPENIFLSRDEAGRLVPKLLDFGVAKLIGDAATGVRHRTRTGTPIGTPQYMSPEQCLALSVDHLSDVYAFGVLCFECLTGKLPFDGAAYVVIANQHTSAERPSVSERNPDLGTSFDAVVKAMMAVDPGERPPSVTAAFRMFADACTAWCDESEQETARRIAKTIRALPPLDELLEAQTTQPWIRRESLPLAAYEPRPVRWSRYAIAFVVACLIGAIFAALVTTSK
jgi:serine/threonine-protein kinase